MSIRISRGIVARYGWLSEAVGAQRPGVVVGDPQPDRPADQPRVDLRTQRTIPGRNRQFSWIISRTPGALHGSIIDRKSDRTSAAGFWQRMCTPCRAARSTSSRCDSGWRADLDEVEPLLLVEQLGRLGVASCLGHLRTGPLQALAGPCRTTRPVRASGTRDQASRWN